MADMRGFTDAALEVASDDERASAETRRVIGFGMDMEAFLRSDVGRYLQARANIEIREFREAFDEVDAEDHKTIANLQREIAVRKVWKDWLMVAINEGNAAQAQAEERGSI